MKESLVIQERNANELLEQNIELLPKFIDGILNSIAEKISDVVVRKMMDNQSEQEESEIHENCDENLNQKEAAKYLKCSITKLWRLRTKSKLKFYKSGRNVLYKKRDLEGYINSVNK